MTNVTEFPLKPDRLEQMKLSDRIGTDVMVDGHVVPHLYILDKGEIVEVCLNHVHFLFPRDLASLAIELAAKALAVGAGHSHISSEHAMTKPYGTKAMFIDGGLPNKPSSSDKP